MACAVPNVIVKWTTVSVACAISILHIVLSLWPKLSVRKLVAFITLLVFSLLHMGLALAFILYFFNYSPPSASIPEPVPEPSSQLLF